MSEKAIVPLGDRQIAIETGKLAKQADGAVTVQLGETIVLVATVGAAKPKEGQDFFPLTVDYREKAAAAGKFPGGYFKREGRPTEKEILTSRLIDRPIRPLFPKGWYNEVQVQSIVLSADGENDPDMLALVGASAALMVSDLPFAGPVGAARIGRVGGEFIANPTHSQMAESDLDLIYVGSETDLVMFEGSAKEISEDDFNAALKFGHEAIQPMIQAQKDLASRVSKAKRKLALSVVPEEILTEAKTLAGDRIVTALLTPAKLEREAAVAAVTDEIGKKLVEKFGAEKVTNNVLREAFYYIQKTAVRSLLMKDGKRLDGRGLEDVRPILSEVGLLPRAHGSALFSRGETQTLTLATLGTGEDAQEFDSYTGGPSEKKFILHYNFPNFSVGETGRISGPGRREIGHGALAERSIEPMVPLSTYPYSIRITSEIMESNGSTSMATVCGGTLALMDAGVPMIRPVGGISIGLCTDLDADRKISSYKLLTDIIGWEDAFCDMDCKIAGTDKGITGFQLDLKLPGIPHQIMTEAVEKARVARLHILAEMAKTLAEPRKELSKYAPRIETIKINPEKIGALIGPGGKNIKKLVEESGCEINIEDDGTVNIYSVSAEGMKIARDAITGMSAEAEIGKIYRGKVVTIKDFGAFVEFLPGRDGLVHISELANFRVKQTEDIVKMGDDIWVKCLGVDEKGRVRLSRKAAMAERDQEHAGGAGGPGGESPAAEGDPERPEYSESRDRGDRPDRGEGADRGERSPRYSGGDRGPRPDRGNRGDRGPRSSSTGGSGGERRPRTDHPEGRSEGRYESRPEGRSEGRPESSAEGRYESRSGGRPEGRYESRPEGRGESRPEGQSEGRSEGRYGSRPEGRGEGRPEGRYTERPEGRGEGRSPSRYESRPEGRPESRPEGRPERTSEGRSEPRPERRPESRPEDRPGSRSESRFEDHDDA